MSDTFDDLLLGPLYTDGLMSAEAVYDTTGAATTIKVMDDTDGVDIGAPEATVADVQPAVTARVSDVDENPVDKIIEVPKGSGTTWRIMGARKLLAEAGQTSGELQLILEKV